MAWNTKSPHSDTWQSIQIYQWIFCLFGSALPPPLYDTSPIGVKRSTCLYLAYVGYNLLLVAGVIDAAWEHNKIICNASIKHDLDCLTSLLSYTHNHLMYVIQILMTLQAFWKRSAMQDILQQMEQLEGEISRLHSKAGVKTSVKWKLLRTIGLNLIAVTGVLVYVNVYILAGNLSTHVKVVMPFFIAAIQMKCLQYGVFVLIVTDLLESVTESLSVVKADMTKTPSFWPMKNMQDTALSHLIRCQMILNRLCLFIKQLEQYFGWHVIFVFLYNGNTILSTMNWSYVSYAYEIRMQNQLCRLSFMLILLYPLLILCSLAEKCKQRYRYISCVINSFRPKPQDSAVRMRIREFLLQLRHQSLLFSCNGYMDINYQTFAKLLLILCSYVVILVQFKFADVSQGAKMATQYIFGGQRKD